MFLKKLNKNLITKNISFIFLILLIIYVTSINYPQLISYWESGIMYRSFLPTVKSLPFLSIHITGDTADFHGIIGYTLLRTPSRWLADLLGHSISNIRIFSVFYGLISIILLFIMTKRYFGKGTAIISSSLLITNLHFVTFQNLLLPQTLTMASILFCVERFLNFKSKQSKFSAISLGLAFAFASIHYVIGRICVVSIMILCLIDYKCCFQKFKNIVTKKSLSNFTIVLLSTIIFLTLFYPLNIFRFLTTEFIFTHQKVDLNFSLAMSFHNIKYFFYYFIFGLQENNYSSNILIDIPFSLVSIITFIFFIYGFVLSIFDIKNINKFIFIYLGGIIFLAILQTGVKLGVPFEVSSNMAPNRTYFLVPFIIVLSSLGLMSIYKHIKQYGELVKKFCILLFVGLIISRLYFFIEEANRFQTYINGYNFDFTKKAIEKELSRDDLEYNRFTLEDQLGLHVNQIYFYNLAKHVAKKTEKYRKDTNKIKLIYIPENYYTPNYLQHGGGHPEKNSPYYFRMFLTFYLQERGINVSYLVNQQDVKGGLIYRIINVVDHYEVRKDNPGLYPKNKSQQNTVIKAKKVISWIESYKWGENLIQSIRQQKNINSKSIFVGNYFINTTSHKDPEYLILSNTSQLEAAKLLSNAKIVLVMPEKIDK